MLKVVSKKIFDLLINEFHPDQVLKTETMTCGIIGEELHAICFRDEDHFISPLLESFLVPIDNKSFYVKNNENKLNG